MFTGLVEGRGKIRSIDRRAGEIRLTIEPSFDISGCGIGDSISVDGVCLTVTGVTGKSFSMDASQETVSLTTIGLRRNGDYVNLERALRLSDRLGGHIVSGHIDGTGRIEKKENRQNSWVIRIGIDQALSRYIITKGSVAVDGISLTVNECGQRAFEVNIIPQTGKDTGLLNKGVGESVNIEADIIGKYVEKLFKGRSSGEKEKRGSSIDLEMLTKHGFGE